MNDREIADRFNRSAGSRYHAVLVGGAPEPLYLPAGPGGPAEIRYTRDYAQSALHELAHWCIAGARRRGQIDYGYWYQPPPRDLAARDRFFAVETRVQGLELLFARVAGVRFHVSVDDPGSDPGDFERHVRVEAQRWLRHGFPTRTRAVLAALGDDWERRLGIVNTDRRSIPAYGSDPVTAVADG